MLTPILRASAALSLIGLAACGGGDTPPEVLDFLDPSGTGTVDITAMSLDSAARTTSTQTGTLNQNTDSFTLGGLGGRINDDRTEVTLDGGGLVTLTDGTAFAALYDATPAGANRTLGVVGLGTPDMPGLGTTTYTGTATVTIQDDVTVYDLTGDATVVASFGAGTVVTTVDGLSGSQTTGLSAPASVSNVGTIEFTGSPIAGAGFTGGTPTLTSGEIADLSGSEASSLDGAFYGPDAANAGAVFVIDDSASGSVTAFGVLLAE